MKCSQCGRSIQYHSFCPAPEKCPECGAELQYWAEYFIPVRATIRSLPIDLKLLVGFCCVVFVIRLTGGILPLGIRIAAVAVALVYFVRKAVQYRRQIGWKWPGASPDNYRTATELLVVGCVFCALASTGLPLESPFVWLWLLALFGMITFNSLKALNLVVEPVATSTKPKFPTIGDVRVAGIPVVGLIVGGIVLGSHLIFAPDLVATYWPIYLVGVPLILIKVREHSRRSDESSTTSNDFSKSNTPNDLQPAPASVGLPDSARRSTDQNIDSAIPKEPTWKTTIRAAFNVVFVLVFLIVGYNMKYSSDVYRTAATEMNETFNVPLPDHGRTIYITRSQESQRRFLNNLARYGIGTVVAVGIVLQYGLGIEFRNRPR